jgi:hypothetical protein
MLCQQGSVTSGFFDSGSKNADYSGFDSALYRKLEAKWHFSQENATSHKLQMARCESKPL